MPTAEQESGKFKHCVRAPEEVAGQLPHMSLLVLVLPVEFQPQKQLPRASYNPTWTRSASCAVPEPGKKDRAAGRTFSGNNFQAPNLKPWGIPRCRRLYGMGPASPVVSSLGLFLRA